MTTDWNGKAEPFKIHPEGWGVIAIVVIMLCCAAGLILS